MELLCWDSEHKWPVLETTQSLEPTLLTITFAYVVQMEAYCDVLELDSVSAAGLSTLTHQLVGFSLELSHLGAVILAKRCFNKQVRLCQVTRYLTETVITQYNFSVPITRKRLLKILTKHLSHTKRKCPIFFVNKMCVGNGDAMSRFEYRGGKIIISPHLLWLE